MLTGIRNIIWDWNGTLLDDVDICVDSINILLEKRKLPLMNIDRYKELFSFPVIEYYKNIGFDFTAEVYDEVATEFMTAYLDRLPSAGLFPQILPLLEACRQGGYQQAVLSAMEQDTLDSSIQSKGIQHYFTKIVGIDNHHAVGKLENAERILKEINGKASETLLIGDTLHDFEVASAIGCPYLLIGSGHQSLRRLSEHGRSTAESHDRLLEFFD
ncbi:MAG: HAD family hydrolase [Bacteroidota bacterium]